MKDRVSKLLLIVMPVLVSLVLVPLMATPASAAAAKVFLVFSSGPTGGSWIPMAAAVAEIVKGAYPEIDIQVEPGAGLVNIEKIRVDKADLGWTMTVSLADACQGIGPFKGKKTDKPMYVMNMYPNVFQLAVPQEAGIKDVPGLKGKAVALPPKGNVSLDYGWAYLLEAYGMTFGDLGTKSYGPLTDNAELIKDRKAVAMGWTTTVPASFVLDLGSVRPLRIFGYPDDIIEKVRQKNAGFAKHVIPAGTYAEQGQKEEVVTFQTPTILIAHSRVPEEAIYKIVKACVEGRERFAAVTKAMRGVTPKDLGKDFGLPYHPGAAKYYKEIGVLK